MKLVVNCGKAKGKIIQIRGPRFLIGRDPECQLRPLSEEVSARHAELDLVAGTVRIKDLGSTQGTRVNGQKVASPVSLGTGDRIEIGPLSFTVLLDEPVKTQRLRRTSEDEIALWLTDEDEGDGEGGEDNVRTPVRQKPNPAAASRRASETQVEDAFELLKTMTIRSE